MSAVPFWDRVDQSGGPNACWPWLGATNQAGYGRYTVHGGRPPQQHYAHRFALADSSGQSIPPGLVVCHRCDNPICCNPDHLFVGTHADNIADRDAKGRTARQIGETHGQAKLTWGKVAEIRASREPGPTLAKIYDVTPSMIWRVRAGLAWRVAQ